MKRITFFLLFCFVIFGCQNQETEHAYPLHVGDIAFDEAIDNPDFFICNEKRIPQYYAFRSSSYRGEKPTVEKYFQENYNKEGLENENGYLTIRFIVNCKGKAGRFRMQEMGLDYLEKKFDVKLSDQLFTLTTQIEAWTENTSKGQPYDYYQYLTFKIIDGEIKEILP